MARNVYTMSIGVEGAKLGYRVLSETAPELYFTDQGRLMRIDWQPVEGEDLTVDFLADLVSDGMVRHVRVYRAQVNRGGREGPFAGRGGRRSVSREPKQEEPWA